MKNELHKAISTVGIVGALLASTYGCDQPPPKCAAARPDAASGGGFIAKYKFVSGPDSCQKLKGERVGIGTYQAEGKDQKPDLDKSSIAIQTASLGALNDRARNAKRSDPNPANKPYAFGAFDSAEPKGDICTVPKLLPALQEFPELPLIPGKPETETAAAVKEVPARPAGTVKYEWSNVKFLVTSTKLGTQFSADMVRTVGADECTYKVIGLGPYIPCSAPSKADPDVTEADPTLCSPVEDLSKGRATGSGIDPDFPTTCDPDLLVCVLTKDSIPALK
jgi:hypothetical protein